MVKAGRFFILSLALLGAACASRKPAVLPVPLPDPPLAAMTWEADSAAFVGIRVDSAALDALVACDTSGIVWVQLPTRQAPVANPGLLQLDVRQLKKNPDMAQRTTSRTLNTIAEVADDYQFNRFARMMRTVNEGQKTTYTRLENWHEQYIENYNIDVRRTRDPVLGGYLYVLGYLQKF